VIARLLCWLILRRFAEPHGRSAMWVDLRWHAGGMERPGHWAVWVDGWEHRPAEGDVHVRHRLAESRSLYVALWRAARRCW
jgi:hypothetical protein